MDRLAERAPVMAPDADGAAYRAGGATRARTAGHLDAGSGRAGRRTADALRARPVHHDVRARRRRDPGQHQRRCVRRDAPGADGARGRQGERGGDQARPPATRWGCAVRTAPPGRWRTAMAATSSWWPAASAWRRCGRRSTSFRRSASGSASWCCCTARAGRRTSCSVGSSRLAAAARHGDRGHRGSRRHRLARPCRRGDQADPAPRHRCRATRWRWSAGRR